MKINLSDIQYKYSYNSVTGSIEFQYRQDKLPWMDRFDIDILVAEGLQNCIYGDQIRLVEQKVSELNRDIMQMTRLYNMPEVQDTLDRLTEFNKEFKELCKFGEDDE